MIKLVILKNPFNISEREVRQVICTGEPVFSYAPILMPDIAISVNGRIIPESEYNTYIPQDGDYIAICPVIEGDAGKDIARTIAGLALFAFSIWTGNFMAAGKAWGFWSYMAAAGVQTAGGYLIGKWLPQEVPELPDQIPGWGALQPISREGNAVPVVFGTVKMGVMAPIQILSQYITYDDDKQYLNLLLSGGEGPCSVSDIKINDSELDNFDNVMIDIREGVNDQDVIPTFNDTREEQYFTDELEEGGDWITHTTEGNTGQGLEVVISFPLGLHYQKDNGKLENTSVTLELEYQKTGDPGWTAWNNNQIINNQARYNILLGDHEFLIPNQDKTGIYVNGLVVDLLYGSTKKTVTVVSSAYHSGAAKGTWVEIDSTIPLTTYQVRHTAIGTFEITAAKNTPFWRVYRIDDLAAGEYSVRIKCIDKDGVSSRYVNSVYWTTLSHINYDDFIHPNKVLVGVRALATDKLSSGLPKITWLQTRSTVQVYNPDLDGYEEQDAFNPAWAAYDVWHYCRKLYDINEEEDVYEVFGVPVSRLDYQLFSDWADFCEDRGLYYNGVLYKSERKWDAIKAIEAAGRGKVIMRGTAFSCFFDGPAEPTQLFNVANSGAKSFKGEFFGSTNRANAIEINFYNIDNDYEKETKLVKGTNYDLSTSIDNPITVDAPYAMTWEQAYKEAKYQLRLNELINQSFSLPAYIDAIACQVGDVILAQYDVLTNGTGGRVESSTTSIITLDREVTMEGGKNYQVIIRLSDDTLLTKAVNTVEGTSNQITVTVPFVNDYHEAEYEDLSHFTVDGDQTETYTIAKTIYLHMTNGDIYETLVVDSVYDDEEDITMVEVNTAVLESLEEVRFGFTLPHHYDLFTFGEVNYEAKKIRLMHTSRQSDLIMQLSGLEYVDAVYTEATVIPETEAQIFDKEIKNLEVVEYKDSVGALWLDISWTSPRYGYNGARVIVDGKQVGIANKYTSKFSHAIDDIEAGTELSITIEAIDDFGNLLDSENISYELIGGFDRNPAAPTGLSYNWDTQDLKVWWSAVTTNDIGIYSEDIKDYQCEFWVGGEKKYTDWTEANLCTYKLAQNISDNVTPATSITIKIYTRGKDETKLSEVAELVCSSSVPTAPAFAVQNAIARISLTLGISNSQLQKFQKFQIKASQNDGFNPDTEGDLVHDSPSPIFDHITTIGETWYYKARIVNKLEQNSTWTAQGTGEALEFPAEFITGEITETQIADDSISTPKLKALAITADKIAANTIKIGTHLEANVPLALAINPKLDKLFHFDNSLYSSDGLAPEAGFVATLFPGEGKYGGCVGVLPANIIDNGSFEDATLAGVWNSASTSTWNTGTNGVLDTTYFKYGKTCVKCGDGAANGKGIAEVNSGSSSHAVTPGDTYTLGFDVMAEDTDPDYIVCIRCFDHDGNNISATEAAPTGWTYSASYLAFYFTGSCTTDWVRVTKEFVVPANTDYIRLSFQYYTNGVASKYVYFDGIQLTKGQGDPLYHDSQVPGQVSFSCLLPTGDFTIHHSIIPIFDWEDTASINSVGTKVEQISQWGTYNVDGFRLRVDRANQYIIFQGYTPTDTYNYNYSFTGKEAVDIVVVVLGTDALLYINGIYQDSITIVRPTSIIYKLYYTTSSGYVGYFDELFIKGSAATADEIAAWHNCNAPFYDPAHPEWKANNVNITGEGIKAQNNGVTTFELDSETGDAYFAGNLGIGIVDPDAMDDGVLAAINGTTAATAGWYRIAETSIDIGANAALFRIAYEGANNKGSIIAGVSLMDNSSQLWEIISGNKGAAGITKIRIVYHTTASGHYGYVEVYNSAAEALTIDVAIVNNIGWILVDPSTVGSVPSGYTNTTRTLRDPQGDANTWEGRTLYNLDRTFGSSGDSINSGSTGTLNISRPSGINAGTPFLWDAVLYISETPIVKVEFRHGDSADSGTTRVYPVCKTDGTIDFKIENNCGSTIIAVELTAVFFEAWIPS